MEGNMQLGNCLIDQFIMYVEIEERPAEDVERILRSRHNNTTSPVSSSLLSLVRSLFPPGDIAVNMFTSNQHGDRKTNSISTYSRFAKSKIVSSLSSLSYHINSYESLRK